ncbi:MAG: hypothetical protein Q7T11_07600 [Deltaproteobacteria bacterium]|nr:hypothetical protein [Deltaproteobacteria bacterium]
MRTTITISEEMLHRVQKLSGRSGLSDAIVSSLEDYSRLKERLSLLDKLLSKKIPHSFRSIKEGRRKKQWCS